MSRLKILFFGIASLSLISGCEKKESESPQAETKPELEYVKYGTSFGECLGYCIKDITIVNTEVAYHASGATLEGKLPELTDKKSIDAQKWADLSGKINAESFLKLNQRYGCPDCADGGAEWIEIKSKGKIHKVLFEYHNEPAETKGYIEDLRNQLASFK